MRGPAARDAGTGHALRRQANMAGGASAGSAAMIALRKHLLSGLLTIVPLAITWIVLELLFNVLSRFGRPWVLVLAANIEGQSPMLADLLREGLLQNVLAVLLVLFAICLLGWATNRVLGRRLFTAFERLVDRVPFVQTVYGSMKRLVGVLQHQPAGVRRIVLIDFPSPEMKTVGLVTRTLRDSATGETLVAVYVPTTPNPTSGYLELVPLERVTPTNWSMDEAMQFVISGGAVAPESIPYHAPRGGLEGALEEPLREPLEGPRP